MENKFDTSAFIAGYMEAYGQEPSYAVVVDAAVEQLKAENEKLRTKLADWQNGAELNELYIRQYDEIQQLKSKLEIAVEALKISALGETQFDGVEAMHAARKALKEINEG